MEAASTASTFELDGPRSGRMARTRDESSGKEPQYEHDNKEQADGRLARMESAVRTILECMSEDPEREGLLATPSRYARAMLSLSGGYRQDPRDVVQGALFREPDHGGMVVVRNIEISSLCEHHLLPFTGKMHIGYVPDGNVVGLSKLARIAEMFARRLQMQERLTTEVARALMEVLQPKGVAVVMEASHMCMVMRGVEQTAASTITSCMLGCFESVEERKEFWALVGVNEG